MYVVIVDVVAVLLIVGGVLLVARRPPAAEGPTREGEGDPRTYARRIAGTMIAAFGLAIGMMVTLFHFQS
jgi:hypothetical protein